MHWKAIDSYWQINNHIEIWSLWLKKNRNSLRTSDVSTIVSLHHLDSNKTPGEKAKRELHNDSASCFEQILEAAPNKTATV